MALWVATIRPFGERSTVNGSVESVGEGLIAHWRAAHDPAAVGLERVQVDALERDDRPVVGDARREVGPARLAVTSDRDLPRPVVLRHPDVALLDEDHGVRVRWRREREGHEGRRQPAPPESGHGGDRTDVARDRSNVMTDLGHRARPFTVAGNHFQGFPFPPARRTTAHMPETGGRSRWPIVSMGHDRVLRTRWWHIAAVMVVVGIVVSAAHTVSIAAAQEPRPEKLWDAYPLDPGQEGAEPADPAPTPTAAPARRAGSPGRSAASEGDGGAVRDLALIGGAAFVVGLGAGEVVRRRRRRATAARAAERKVAPAATSAPAAPATADFLPQAPQPPGAPSDGAPATAEPERPEADGGPLPVPRPQGRDPAPARWIAPAPPRADPPPSALRFARARGWPEEAGRAWTCEIDWKPGYIKSGFRAMAAPPGEPRRSGVRAVQAGQVDVDGRRGAADGGHGRGAPRSW